MSHGHFREPRDDHAGGGQACSAGAQHLTERKPYYNAWLQNKLPVLIVKSQLKFEILIIDKLSASRQRT